MRRPFGQIGIYHSNKKTHLKPTQKAAKEKKGYLDSSTKAHYQAQF